MRAPTDSNGASNRASKQHAKQTYYRHDANYQDDATTSKMTLTTTTKATAKMRQTTAKRANYNKMILTTANYCSHANYY